jgi:beta-phosphoglucomutase-like phosphatase (HAD superfamily)
MPHLLLDLDNTLVGTEDLVLPVFLDLLKQDYALEISEDDFYALFLGKAGKNLYRAIAMHYGVTFDEDALLAKQTEANYKAMRKKGVPEAPRMIETLSALYEQGWSMAIVSNSSDEKIRLTLDCISEGQREILKSIIAHRIVSCDDCQKPDPYGYLKALEVCGVPEDDTVFCVEDSVSGAKAALSAGLPVFGYTGFSRDPAKAENALLDAGCAAVFNNWKDLPRLLKHHMAEAGESRLTQRR